MLEVYGRPGMVWKGVVGYYATGEHKKRVREGPSGQGGMKCWHDVNGAFLLNPKGETKPATETLNEGGKVQPRDKSPAHKPTESMRQKRQGLRGVKRAKQVRIKHTQTQASQLK